MRTVAVRKEAFETINPQHSCSTLSRQRLNLSTVIMQKKKKEKKKNVAADHVACREKFTNTQHACSRDQVVCAVTG